MSELLGPRPVSAPELLAQIEAERVGEPFVAYRDEAGEHRIFAPGARTTVWIGGAEGTDLRLPWDVEVSSLHAQLERGGDNWTLIDEGLSLNART